jgi:uncharacterized protein (DUF885 family)
MQMLVALLLSTALIAGCRDRDSADTAAQAPPVETAERIAGETARLNEWFDARYEEQLDFSPIQKTMLGRKQDYHELDDLSERAQDAQLAWQRQTVEDLRQGFDYTLLTPEARISYDLWTYALEEAEAALPFRRRHYLFHQMDGFHTALPQFLINFHRVDEDADMVAYIARIGEAARVIDQALARARLAAGEGVHAPRFAYETVREQARALVSGAPFGGDGDSPLFADASAKIDALAADGRIDAARAETLRRAAATALTERFEPAYDALIGWVEAELPNTREIATGVWTLPDGAAYYEERLAAETTTDMSADEVHALGLAEVERIHAEMEAIQQKVGFAGSLQEFFEFVREDRQFYFPNTDEGREAYLRRTRDYLAFIQQRLPEYFGLLPKAGLIVKRVEAFREQPGAAQHYFQGTPDGSRPGIYYMHLVDMNAMSKTEMENVAYHEGNPGHHMQISIAQELVGLPTFRTQIGFTAYSEGWALYAERLGKEMGAYQDPYSDFGRLAGEIWRAIRLVVDTGLHAKGWSEAEAVAYFMANSPTSQGQIRSEIRRYIVLPGQATAYKVGMLKIQELRARAEAALGEAFDLRGFHDSVLGGGALPISILERRVDEWIDATSMRRIRSPSPSTG